MNIAISHTLPYWSYFRFWDGYFSLTHSFGLKPQKFKTKKFDVKKLEISLCGTVAIIFRYLEPLSRVSPVWQTDGQTEWPLAIAQSNVVRCFTLKFLNPPMSRWDILTSKPKTVMMSPLPLVRFVHIVNSLLISVLAYYRNCLPKYVQVSFFQRWI